MFTYQLQYRTCALKEGEELSFPNDVQLEIHLEPTAQFGVGQHIGKTMVKKFKDEKVPLKCVFNSHTGKTNYEFGTVLEPLSAFVESGKLSMVLDGNVIRIDTRCETSDEFDDRLFEIHYIMPILINMECEQPPVISSTSGRVGTSLFYLQLSYSMSEFSAITKVDQEKKLVALMNHYPLLCQGNHRLLAALHYYHIACRLIECGNTPSEFLSECILNLCKVLEVLFGSKHDIVREDLIKLGYSITDIEEMYIPIMLLRNQFDVGHVSISYFEQEQLNILYVYLENSLRNFRKLLKTLILHISDNKYSLKPVAERPIDPEKKRTLDKLITLVEKRIGKKEIARRFPRTPRS